MEMRAHLKSRWFNPEFYSGVTIDADNMTVSLWNMSGQMVGYHCYNPSLPKCHIDDPKFARYFTWVTKGKSAVWGLETLSTMDTSVVYLTEGIFDACRLHHHGKAAIAMLGNNPLNMVNWLKMVPFKTCAAVQGDKAGRELAKFADIAIYLPEGKDVGNLTDAEFTKHFFNI